MLSQFCWVSSQLELTFSGTNLYSKATQVCPRKYNKENLFYRVRVGPYTTKSEAEYWRTRINKIDEFAKAESYVTSTTKTAN